MVKADKREASQICTAAVAPGRGSTDTCCLQSGLLPHDCRGQGVRAQGAAAPRLEQPLPSLHLCVTLAFSVFEIPDYRGPGRPEVIFPTIVLEFGFHFPGSPRSSGEGLCWVSSRYEGRGRGAENTLRSLSPPPPLQRSSRAPQRSHRGWARRYVLALLKLALSKAAQLIHKKAKGRPVPRLPGPLPDQ